MSNVLNHPEKVRATRKERVLAVIQELQFVPNDAARALRVGSPNTGSTQRDGIA
ncbi:LacI family DNA-binding transcriptional regulator [Frondihabitans sp. PhB161]|uniref:LacI family DNA-binding transcriptional regulator n=1 Tax=unclassified Frondihabitans TaxID=2626248 RepID=UPI003514657B